MHDCQCSRTARLCGVIFTGLMLIGLLPHAFASPGDDALEDRIEARDAGAQTTADGRTNDRLGDLSRRNAQDRSSLRGGQERDSLLDDPEMLRFFDKMPPEIFATFGHPDAVELVQDGVQSSQFQRPRPVPEYLFSDITAAELNGMPVVEFQITDEFGLGIEGFDQGENVAFSFTVNKLVPGSGGETNNWSTYMVADDEGVPNVSAGTYSDGTLEDLGGGNYRFTFADSLEAIAGVMFEPELTHRVGMEVRSAQAFGGSIPNSNTFDNAFDIQPSTGETSGITMREIVEQENCTSCHGTEDFAFHGGARKDVRQCVSCHQPNKIDPGGGETLDFRVMVHKIHTGVNLSEPYEFCGFGCESRGAPPDNFNHVVYPQSTQNCVTCHNPENPATPQAENIDSAATAQVCASCHDGLAFDENGLTNANRNHIGLAQPNETCEACHSPTGLLQGNLAYHVIESQAEAQKIAYNILDVSDTGEGMSPIVTFEVVNPLDGTTYDLMSAPAFNGPGTSVNMTFAWPTVDFTNVTNDAGTEAALGARTTSIQIAGSSGLRTYVFDNGDGTYTLDTGMLDSPLVIPSTMPPLGSGQVAIEGHPAADLDFDGVYDEDIPVTNVVQAFAITDASPTPRREVVSLAKCQTCHNVNDGLALHGGNRTDNVQNCVSCHNPNGTDINRRPDDPDGIANAVNSATLDGHEDQSISMQYMIHAIHGASVRTEPYVAYGFGGTAHDYSDASYPRSPADCQACHDGDTYTLPLASERLAVTVNTGATNTASGFAPSRAVAEDPTDDNNVSAESAACLSCHTSELAQDHMAARSDSQISFGNGWLMNPDPIGDPDTQAFIDTQSAENCSFCHSESGFVPVSEVHGIVN